MKLATALLSGSTLIEKNITLSGVTFAAMNFIIDFFSNSDLSIGSLSAVAITSALGYYTVQMKRIEMDSKAEDLAQKKRLNKIAIEKESKEV